MHIVTKSWDELVAEFGSFVNEDNFNMEEIHLSNDNYYITGEYSMILGREVEAKRSYRTNGWIYFTNEDGGHYLCKDMIKSKDK